MRTIVVLITACFTALIFTGSLNMEDVQAKEKWGGECKSIVAIIDATPGDSRLFLK
jgi:hypothetical protein